MKILIVNYRYYEAGGPERYMFNVSALLEQHGHTVIPFSLKYSQNKPSHYSEYFADPPGNEDSFFYKDLKRNASTLVSLASRQFFSRSVYNKLEKLIYDTKPDVAYILHFMRKMSPSVIDACYDNHVPVVLRISDFALLCPQCCFFRNNSNCELCQSDLLSSVKHRCVKGSLFASALNYSAYKFHDVRKVFKSVSQIVCPSNFTAQKFRQNYRFKQFSTVHVPTFVSDEVFKSAPSASRPVNKAIGYWGRIDYDKGIHILLDAMKILRKSMPEVTLTIIGDGDEHYVEQMRQKIHSDGLTNVTMMPFLQKARLFEKISQFDVVVLPSLWYDNMPNSLLEAQALGIPGIVSKTGSLEELIRHGENGYHFECGNSESLSRAFSNFFQDEEKILSMRSNSVGWANAHYSSGMHYEKILSVFNQVLL